jgi:thymidylate synthase
MNNYHDLINKILEKGTARNDRTGVGTIGLFGEQLRFDLTKGFPAVTTKKLAWKSVVSELLWFIEGSGDERRLAEILYGNKEARTDQGILKPTIWTQNSQAEYWTKNRNKKHKDDLGRIYGVQWRAWRVPVFNVSKMGIKHIDQLQQLIKGLREDPYSRRHIITAWNPGELDMMALPPCHCFVQFYVRDNKLSCQMYQRSADIFLGVPFNIASYALFTEMIAQCCGMVADELIITFGDVHLYNDHIEQAKEQLSRSHFPLPKLKLNTEIKDITKFNMTDFELVNYQHHQSIAAPMAV